MTATEPTLGSVAFLNEVISQLCEAYLNKKTERVWIDDNSGESSSRISKGQDVYGR